MRELTITIDDSQPACEGRVHWLLFTNTSPSTMYYVTEYDPGKVLGYLEVRVEDEQPKWYRSFSSLLADLVKGQPAHGIPR